MKKRNKINVYRENPSKDNAIAYFAKTVALYNNGDYEAALRGFKKLSEFIDTVCFSQPASITKNLLIPRWRETI